MSQFYCSYFFKSSILVGLLFFVGISAHYIKEGRWKPNSFIAGSSFFIFAYHALPLSIIVKSMLKILPFNTFGALIMYFGAPIITIILGLILYGILRKYFPNITNIITGGR